MLLHTIVTFFNKWHWILTKRTLNTAVYIYNIDIYIVRFLNLMFGQKDLVITKALYYLATWLVVFKSPVFLLVTQSSIQTLRFNLLDFSLKHLHYVPPALTFRNSVFCPQCIYVFCVDLRTKSDYFSTALTYRFLKAKQRVYCAVRNGSLNQTGTISYLKG